MKQRVTGTWPRSDAGLQLALHVTDHVLLEEEAQVAGMQVVDQRRGERQDVAGQLPHLLGHLQLGDAIADQRFVDVEMEEPHLGVGDAPQRLGVDADELEEGDQREAGGEHPGAVAQRLHVVGVEQALALQRGAEDDEDALDQLRLEAGLARRPAPPSPAPRACGKRSSVKPKASRPSRPARFRSSSEWPRSRIRATTRAWAAAAAVQRPRRTGTTFSSAQRFSVPGETPARREASLRDMRSSAAIGDRG